MSFDHYDDLCETGDAEVCCECGSLDVCTGVGDSIHQSYCSRCWNDPRRVGGSLAEQFAELGDDE